MPKEAFGAAPRPGYLVADRDGGGKRVSCLLQYCYGHLLGEDEDLERELPEVAEVTTFVNTVAPLLTRALGLRVQAISAPECAWRAAELKGQSIAGMDQPA